MGSGGTIQGHRGQDGTYVEVTGGGSRLKSPVLPLRTQGSSEVRSEVGWTFLCPPLPDWRPHGNLARSSGTLAGSYAFLCLSLPSSVAKATEGAGLRCWGD